MAARRVRIEALCSALCCLRLRPTTGALRNSPAEMKHTSICMMHRLHRSDSFERSQHLALTTPHHPPHPATTQQQPSQQDKPKEAADDERGWRT